jgi:hypothetical protein
LLLLLLLLLALALPPVPAFVRGVLGVIGTPSSRF